eukprot:5186183-Pyramimonas_sp.AAC.1
MSARFNCECDSDCNSENGRDIPSYIAKGQPCQRPTKLHTEHENVVGLLPHLTYYVPSVPKPLNPSGRAIHN